MFIGHGGMNHRVIGDSEPGWLVTDVTLNDSLISLSHRDFGPDRPSLTTTPVSTRLTADYLSTSMRPLCGGALSESSSLFFWQ
jgi:hypothetical protein